MPRHLAFIVLLLAGVPAMQAPPPAPVHQVERFEMSASGPVLDAPSRAGRFIASIGARAAALGYEHRPFELWAWPLKIPEQRQCGVHD